MHSNVWSKTRWLTCGTVNQMVDGQTENQTYVHTHTHTHTHGPKRIVSSYCTNRITKCVYFVSQSYIYNRAWKALSYQKTCFRPVADPVHGLLDRWEKGKQKGAGPGYKLKRWIGKQFPQEAKPEISNPVRVRKNPRKQSSPRKKCLQ